MSAAQHRAVGDRHRDEADRFVRRARQQSYDDAARQCREAAQVHALLAIEARLAALVATQREALGLDEPIGAPQ